MKSLRTLLTLFALCTGFYGVPSALGTTYYASPSGTKDGSSYTKPCSFSYGLSKITNPGDTLYLLGGQYDLGNTQIGNKVGSSSRHIVIAGYPGEQAILDFRTTPYGTRGLQVKSTCSYLHIRNLTLRYSGKNNLLNEGSYCLFENLDIYGSADTGCQMKNGGNNIILNVDSHDNFDYQNGSLSNADFGGNADGFADKQHSGGPNHYIGCRAWNNSDDGWDFFQRVTTSETIIENCICYKNGPAEYDMRNHPRYQTDKSWFDNVNGKTITNRYGNQQVVSMQHYPNHGNGNGFKLGGGFTNHKVLVHHCLSVGNTVRGFDQNNNDGTMRIYNNTGLKNGYNFGFTTAYGTLSIQNNVSYQGTNKDAPNSKTTIVNTYNSWNNKSASSSDFVSTDTTQILGARDAEGNLPTMTLMHLKAGSKFINAGIDVGLPYYGIAPDMGCYEVEEGVYHNPGDTIPDDEPVICPEGAVRVAFVTTPKAPEDALMLAFLRADSALCITIVDAAETNTDYSEFDAIVLGPKPSSTAAGFGPLKTVDKPKLVLKPFLYKASVWNWGTAVNTQDLNIVVTDTQHELFTGLEFTNGNELQLFESCTTNAVTAISAWTITAPTTLASPVSQPTYSTLSLSENLITLGVSEYSTAQLTETGLQLILNCVRHLCGLPLTTDPFTGLDEVENSEDNSISAQLSTRKLLINGHLILLRADVRYNVLGTPSKD